MATRKSITRGGLDVPRAASVGRYACPPRIERDEQEATVAEPRGRFTVTRAPRHGWALRLTPPMGTMAHVACIRLPQTA
jgi:hypothetical protein